MGCAVALANIDILEREDLPGRVLRHESELRGELETLREVPIVGDVRGEGYFYGIELVRDQETNARCGGFVQCSYADLELERRL